MLIKRLLKNVDNRIFTVKTNSNQRLILCIEPIKRKGELLGISYKLQSYKL